MAGADWGEVIYRNGVYQPGAEYLGAGRVRVYIHKNYPKVLLDGVELDAKGALTWREDIDPTDGYIWADLDEGEYSAVLEGHRFQARHVAGNMIDVELIEPDGTIWQARGGYEVGERFLEDDETPGRLYQRLMSHRFHWTQITQPHSTE